MNEKNVHILPEPIRTLGCKTTAHNMPDTWEMNETSEAGVFHSFSVISNWSFENVSGPVMAEQKYVVILVMLARPQYNIL